MIGTQLGAYRVLQQIGEGGMGSVWLAEHAMLGRRAAIKVLHPSYSQQPEIVARFFNEARAATAISDPGIVQVFDFGHANDGSAYIVMELLDGEPLDKRLRRNGTLPVADVLRIMRQVAGSLGAAHTRGIVHRDLKPENIFMVRDPEVNGGERAKILDFGIAKLIGDKSSKTSTSAVMGTPTYMSPEQCRGAGQVDQRSDVYALGCVMFALMTGRPPFDAEGVGEIIAMHLREAPPKPSSINPMIGADIDQLVMVCLAKDPAQRFASATALGSALSTLLAATSGIPIAMPVGTTPHLSRPHTSPTTLSQSAASISVGTGTQPPPAKKKTGLLIGLAAVVVIGGGVTAAVVASGGGKTEPAAPPAPAPTEVAVAPAPKPAEAPPKPVEPPPAPPAPVDPRVELGGEMKQLLARFVAWTHDHPTTPCPDVAALGGDPTKDAWGHPMQLTCSDQPSKQMAGAVSAGPDGTFGTADDIASWQLDNAVGQVVAGPHWAPKAPPSQVHHVQTPPTTVATAKKPPQTPPPVVTAPPPPPPKPPAVELDERGFPKSR